MSDRIVSMRGKRGPNKRSLALLGQIDERYGGTGKFVHSLLRDIDDCQDCRDRAVLKLKLMRYIYPTLQSIDVSGMLEDSDKTIQIKSLTAELERLNQIEIEAAVAKRLKEVRHEDQAQHPASGSPELLPSLSEASASQGFAPTADLSEDPKDL